MLKVCKLRSSVLELGIYLSLCALLSVRLAAQACPHAAVYTTESLLARDRLECELIEAPACQRLRPAEAEAIFIGRVIKIDEKEGHIIVDGACDKTSLQTVTVKVTERFVGNPPDISTIHAGDLNGFYFKTGKVFLIVAKRVLDGSFTVTSCGGTRFFGKDEFSNGRADVTYLRSWASLPKSATIFGESFIGTDDPRRIVQRRAYLQDQIVTLSGPRTVFTKTDKTGAYKVDGLVAGTYTVSLDSPFFVWPDRLQTVAVVERGCAKVDFNVVTNHSADGSYTQKQGAKAKP